MLEIINRLCKLTFLLYLNELDPVAFFKGQKVSLKIYVQQLI